MKKELFIILILSTLFFVQAAENHKYKVMILGDIHTTVRNSISRKRRRRP